MSDEEYVESWTRDSEYENGKVCVRLKDDRNKTKRCLTRWSVGEEVDQDSEGGSVAVGEGLRTGEGEKTIDRPGSS